MDHLFRHWLSCLKCQHWTLSSDFPSQLLFPEEAETNTSIQHFLSFGNGNRRSRANGKRIEAAITVRNIPTVGVSIPLTAIWVAAGVAPQMMTVRDASK
jgi:hypothetical protein